MADFSKQWVVNFECENGGWDFDIEEVASKLKPGEYKSCICEGFGFVAVVKFFEDEINLVFIDEELGEFTFKTIEETINFFKNEI